MERAKTALAWIAALFALEQHEAKEALDANVLHRVVLGLSAVTASHRPPGLEHLVAAVSNA